MADDCADAEIVVDGCDSFFEQLTATNIIVAVSKNLVVLKIEMRIRIFFKDKLRIIIIALIFCGNKICSSGDNNEK